MSLGNAIKLVRTRRRISQQDLAARAGISSSYLSQLERDKRDPTYSRVRHIAEALNISTLVLVFLSEGFGTNDDLFDRELSEKISYMFLKDIDPS